MLKKNSIISFILLTIIAVLGVLLCVCPFAMPASSDRYNGFIDAINKGIDLNGGVSAIYKCEAPSDSDEEIDAMIDASMDKVKNILKKEGYSEIFVTRQGKDKIRVEVSGAKDTDANFKFLTEEKAFFVVIDKLDDKTTTSKTYLTSEDIESVNPDYDYDAQSYGLKIKFTENAKNKIKNLKEDAKDVSKENAYVYIDKLDSNHLMSEFALKDIKKDEIFIKASDDGAFKDSKTSPNEITKLSYSIVGGTLGFDTELMEVSAISPILGRHTLLLIGISFLITFIATIIFMYVRYGTLGLLGDLAIIFYSVIMLFLLQSIPFVTLNLAGVFGILFAFAVGVGAICLIFEKIRAEYALGQKIHLSCKGGLKKALWPILDSHFIILIASTFMWIFAPSIIKAFAYILFIGTILSMFTSLVLTRWFIKLYLPINSTNASVMHLYRDDKKVMHTETEIADNSDVEISADKDVAILEEGGDK